MTFHVNHLLADDSHEMSSLIYSEKYKKNENVFYCKFAWDFKGKQSWRNKNKRVTCITGRAQFFTSVGTSSELMKLWFSPETEQLGTRTNLSGESLFTPTGPNLSLSLALASGAGFTKLMWNKSVWQYRKMKRIADDGRGTWTALSLYGWPSM